jgi:hypothetical protein
VRKNGISGGVASALCADGFETSARTMLWRGKQARRYSFGRAALPRSPNIRAVQLRTDGFNLKF